MSKLLLEIFSEEIPAKMQIIAIEKLTELLLEAIPYSNITHFISPRHICLSIDNLQLVNKMNLIKLTFQTDPQFSFLEKKCVNFQPLHKSFSYLIKIIK